MAASEKGHFTCGNLLVAASEMYNDNEQSLEIFIENAFEYDVKGHLI